jgi:hypothetical protein
LFVVFVEISACAQPVSVAHSPVVGSEHSNYNTISAPEIRTRQCSCPNSKSGRLQEANPTKYVWGHQCRMWVSLDRIGLSAPCPVHLC